MPDRYFVCGVCAHFWSAPEHPEECENCRRGGYCLVPEATVEAAEDASQAVLDAHNIREEGNIQ
jgi:hypothetical protein